MARCRELFPRCASCGNAGSVQAVALRLKINLKILKIMSVIQRARMLIKFRNIMAKRDGHTVPVFRTSSAKIRPRQR